ncbi:MAG: complex I subunit 4 family protein [Bacteroidales bacterium]
MNLLILTFIIPALTLLILFFVRSDRAIHAVAAAGSGIQLAFTLLLGYVYYMHNVQTGLTDPMFATSVNWFAPLNIHFSYALDGLAMVMLVLTSLVVFAGTLVSFDIEKQTKEFFILLTLLALGAYGFFLSRDLFMMFFFLELAVIPKYLLIAMYGSGKKESNALKLALMLTFASALVFIGIVAVYSFTGSWDLMEVASLQLPLWLQTPLYLLTFTGFGIFTAMFPFHSWAPDGHSSAPTAASMFLAGVSMKLGGFGCLRVANFLFPEAASEFSWIFVILGSASIVYGAFVTLGQKDLKYMNAFSSVSHCGFVILGVAMLTPTAATGAVIQMVSHGVMTALFFAVIGMIYKRTHTRQMSEMGGILQKAPFIGSLMLLVGLCSLGLPGMSGFVAEMTVFVGSWERIETGYRIATVLACSSIVITAVYILRAIGKVIWGSVTNHHIAEMKDATWNERLAAIGLLSAIFFIGIMPFVLTQFISGNTEIIAARYLPVIINIWNF